MCNRISRISGTVTGQWSIKIGVNQCLDTFKSVKWTFVLLHEEWPNLKYHDILMIMVCLSCFTVYRFQENLLKTMKEIENTYFDLAETSSVNTLVICDRGTMDASACE